MSSLTGAPLTFEKADFGDGNAAEVMTCVACPENIQDTYYEVNGVNVCEDCRAQVAGTQKTEGGPRRFVGAVLLGVGGGILGAVIWYAVAEVFDLQIGLIAILVGWLVGNGVHKGSEGRGGLKYQLLAAVVTYISICSTYIPYMLPGATDKSAVPVTAAPKSASEDIAPSTVPDNNADADATVRGKSMGASQLLLYVGSIVGFALIAPFWLGFSNIIGILIIGFAVHHAWKINGARVFDVKGPFRVARPVPHPDEPSTT
ncbi:MAG: hypothetical protein ABIR28_01815 [Vicinamibacteria bacterium]